MDNNDNTDVIAESRQNDANDQAELEEILQQEAGVTRLYRRFDRWLIRFIALSWALFQLSLPRLVVLDSVFIRSIHLAFAMALVFLGVPATRKRKEDIKGLHSLKHTPAIDFFLAAVGVVVATYIVWNWNNIAARMGIPTSLDIILGVVLIILLLDASRRGIGLPMVIIALIFTMYGFFGRYMPGVFAWRGISLGRYIGQTVLSSEGIFGIPLDVSARTVYLFVLFGAFLERFGAGKFFNAVSISLLGKYKGGPAKAAVVSSGFTGLVSGSSIANVVTTGTFTIPLMKKIGYPGKTAAATEVAASTNGQLMPPIMGAAAFIIAEYLGIGYLDVVKAAIIPAVVSYIALFYITHLEASKLGIKGLAAADIPNFVKTMKEGFHHLIPLTILIFELAVMRRSPNLAVFNAILYLLGIYIIREVWSSSRQGVKAWDIARNIVGEIRDALIQGSFNMIPVALATATAGIIVGIVNLGIGSMIVQIVEVISLGNVFLLLFFTAFFSLVIGMGLPTTATYIVMASLTVPIITRLGANMGLVIPAIAAHLFCFYFGILADDTPPVGLAAYAAAAIAKSDPIPTGIKGFIYDLRTALIPFMFVFNPLILLVGVNDWGTGLLIFAATTVGTLAFTNAVQGWALVRNKWYEIPVFMAAAFFLYLPNVAASLFSWNTSMFPLLYLIGVAIYASAFGLQKLRMRSPAIA